MHRTPITQQGYNKLLAEKKKLLQERPLAVKELARARDMGDLSENGFYKGARAKLSQIDRYLRHINRAIISSYVVNSKFTGVIGIGCTVVLANQEETRTIMLVGVYETNPLEGKISNMSPLGKELIGRKKGEKFFLAAPAGNIVYEIMEVRSKL